MTDDELLRQADELQDLARRLLHKTPVLQLLRNFGDPVETGSSAIGLMVYPDIDLAVQTDAPDIGKAIELFPDIFYQTNAHEVKITKLDGGFFYIGIVMPFTGKIWKIDATVCPTGIVGTDPPELKTWLQNVSPKQRLTILRLKNKLLNSKRYVGAKSQPPYTFRSTHLYEGVLAGNVQTITQLEKYWEDKLSDKG